MKTVFSSHSEVCHIWAQQNQSEGRASRIFFNGPSIFSYGRHFEMARFITPDIVFITTNGYPKSTSKHLGRVWRAASHKTTFTVPSFTDHNENVEYFVNQIQKTGLLLARSRTRAESYFSEYMGYVNTLNNYIELFKSKISKPLIKSSRRLIKEVSKQKFSEIMENQKDFAKIQREKKAKDLAEKVKLWKAGEFYGNIDSDTIYLKVSGDSIVTSLGAIVNIKEALDVYIKAKAGLPVHGLSLGSYTVNGYSEGILTVGCHKITMAEMDRLAPLVRQMVKK